MSTAEMPTINSSMFMGTCYNGLDEMSPVPKAIWPNEPSLDKIIRSGMKRLKKNGPLGPHGNLGDRGPIGQYVETEEEDDMSETKRLVQVFIVDPDKNVPLADSLLYKDEPRLTDLTDQELFFEIDVRTALATHNEKRVKFINKDIKERTEYLEPARIRDLKMHVAVIAKF